MNKVVYLPLDERPCNYKFPSLFLTNDLEIVNPPIEILGNKKIPGDVNKIANWLKKEASDAKYLVVSLDMLIYGGIVPSRLHHDSYDTLIERLEVIKEIKKINPQLIIYAFELIMRCPQYSSGDEEPLYYEDYGKDIFTYGVYLNKKQDGILTPDEETLWSDIKNRVPLEVLNDYIERRNVNQKVLSFSLRLICDGVIDFFIIPQDDSAYYGFTTLNKREVKKIIEEYKIENKILMYPGADEIGMTLLARVHNSIHNYKPSIYPIYASKNGKNVKPLYEDRPVDDTITYQILAINGIRANSILEADLILAINIGSGMNDYNEIPNPIYYEKERNLDDFITNINNLIKENKEVTIADIAYANKGDLDLYRLFEEKDLLFKISGYAGWNTSSNTIGTALYIAICSHFSKDYLAKKKCLAHRYVEDVFYCGMVRLDVTKNLYKYKMNFFDVKEENGLVARIVEKELKEKIGQFAKKLDAEILKISIKMPWRRMFEIDLSLEVKNNENNCN